MGISVSTGVADPAWITPSTLLNGWTTYDPTGFRPFRYRKLNSGLVLIAGLIKGGTAAAFFQMPPGYRISAGGGMVFPTIENSAVARVDLYADGTLSRQLGGNTWLTLDGICWYAEA